jgi:acyl carrier protein
MMGSPHGQGPAPRTEVEIRAWLIASVARVVKIKPEQVDAGMSFDAMGMDSLQAVSLSGDLEQWFGAELSPTIVWDYPSIDRLVPYLVASANRHSEPTR